MVPTVRAARKGFGAAALAAAALLFGVALARTAWVTDDAFITLRTIDNLLAGYGLRWNVAERVQDFTHPLWLGVVTLFYAATRAPFASALAAGLVVSLAGAGLIAWRYRHDPVRAALVLSALTFSKAYVDFSTSGLENPLTHLLLFGFAMVTLDSSRDSRVPPAAAGALVSGLALTRPDAVVLVLPALATSRYRSTDVRRLAAGLSPWLLWEAFSLVYYGALVPNTALAKLGSGVPRGELALQGLAYLGDSLRRDPITLVVIAAGAAAGVLRGGRPARALAAGIALHLAYVVSIGGDFMTGRFLTPALALSVVLLAETGLPSSRRVRLAAAAGIAVLGLPFARATVLSGPTYGDRAPIAVGAHGIADERGFYFAYAGAWNGSPEPGRPTTALSFVRAGLDLKAAHATIATLDAIGFAGYLAGPATHIVDTLALADPFLARLPMVRRAPPPFAAPGSDWRIGHFERAVPAGYLATIATGEDHLADPALKALWADVALATRAPLLAPGRASAIARLLLRRPPVRERPPYRPTDWDELLAIRPGELDARYRRALSKLASDPAAARADLEAVVAAAPGHGGAEVELARAELKDGRVDDALLRLDRYLAERPGAAEAMLQRAEALRMRGGFDAAEAAYLEAGRRAPNLRPAAWTSAALLRAHRGDVAGARELIASVLSVTPRYEPALRAQQALRAGP